ncbi:hypothetical protein [Umezawaea beigongshangensis]|uniref:hypothetical protein n=1 Tax=Umezawaea beigongshangensis TaxID=2780383 RepID=UPI0018F1A49A|nr:hypothetical protein [Umezawaea beigongshangensis]
MDTHDIDDHPDLRDGAWIRAANRRARRDARRTRRRARLPAHSGALVAAISVASVGVLLVGLHQRGVLDPLLPDRAAASPTTETGTETETGTTATPAFDPERPFTGTPAASWAEGEAGVVPPAAAPVGDFAAEQVADACERVRRVPVASRLDRSMLERHDPSAFLPLLAPDHRAQVEPLFAGGQDQVAASYATRVRSGSTLLPASPRVKGRTWAEQAGPGQLVVHTDYAFSYAFRPGESQTVLSPMDVVSVHRAR